nr:DNA-directed RNA polymerase [uncultured Cohaesibacter sp.]
MNAHVNPSTLDDATLLEEQAELEIEMQARGAVRYRQITERSLEKGRAAHTAPGSFLIKRVVDPVHKAVTEYVAASHTGKPGRRVMAAKMIEGMDPKVIAYLTSQTIISKCFYSHQTNFRDRGMGTHIHQIAMALATALEDEARFDYFEAVNPGLFRMIENRQKELGTTDTHKRKVMVYSMGKYNIPWERWSQTNKLSLGVRLIELFEESTGLITVSLERTSAFGRANGKETKQAYFVRLTDQVTEWFNQQLLRGELLRPFFLPTIIEPAEWPKNYYGGGYHTDAVRPRHLVTGIGPEHRDLLSRIEMPKVLSAIHAVQETGWQINSDVLDVIRQAEDGGISLAGMATYEDPEKPPKPTNVGQDPDILREWKTETKIYHARLTRLRSERLRQASLLETAGRFKDTPRIFFPHQLDFRGRFYPIPQGLHPQGNDMTKALLRFADGVPLGNQQAADWLAVHGANVWGEDKVSLEERMDWVDDHEFEIVQSAEDPMGFQWWTKADKPWCFLAFCFEWRQYLIEGFSFKSKIPVALDGSCNGLQHFSAMLRDPIGGAAVNLIPSHKPQDIYQRVADRAIERLKEEAKVESEQQWMAEAWVGFGLNRKITKRPVMVLPYGGTLKSCMDYVHEAVTDRIEAGSLNPFGDDLKKATAYLGKIIWASISDVVVAARSAMDWLQVVARECSKAGYPMRWRTPSGFLAYQDYRDMKARRVKTKLHGSVVFFQMQEETDKLNNRKQATAISPNFIHSMDASAMVLTINQMIKQGVRDFAMIHDSYGTHAANTEALAQTLRHAFVEMYSVDVLQGFLNGLSEYVPQEVIESLPPLPQKGSLNIQSVLESEFFFA